MGKTRRNLGGGERSAEHNLTRHFNFIYNYYVGLSLEREA